MKVHLFELVLYERYRLILQRPGFASEITNSNRCIAQAIKTHFGERRRN